MTSAVGDNFETDSAPRKKGERSQPAKQTTDVTFMAAGVSSRLSLGPQPQKDLACGRYRNWKLIMCKALKIAIKIIIQMTLAVLSPKIPH